MDRRSPIQRRRKFRERSAGKETKLGGRGIDLDGSQVVLGIDADLRRRIQDLENFARVH